VGPIPGWTNSGNSGQWQPGNNPLSFNYIPDGSTVAYSNDPGGTITQTVGTVAPNTTYTLRVDLGLKSDGYDSLGTVALLIGSTPVYAIGVAPTPGNWSTFTATYTSTAADIGQTLTIQLIATGNQSDFDNVRLTASIPQTLPQFAFGGSWYSALYFTNSSAGTVSFTVNFTSDSGTPLTVPSLGSSSTTVALAPQATTIVEAPNIGPLNQGYVTVTLPDGVTAYGIFRQSVPGVPDQEAVVPFSDASSTSRTLLWDDTVYTTAVAITNPSAVPVTVSITAWNAVGNIIGNSSLSLAAGTKTEAPLRYLPGLAAVAGSRGYARFAVTSGSIAVLGLRFNGTAFTSIPTTQP
jgi:hypothetical protein